jgi:hypothetical protein
MIRRPIITVALMALVATLWAAPAGAEPGVGLAGDPAVHQGTIDGAAYRGGGAGAVERRSAPV